MPANIQFDWDRPVTLRIEDPDHDCQGYDNELRCGHYQTVEGVPFRLPRPAVIALNALEVLPGEEIGICRRHDGKGTKWDIWLTPRAEKARATAETAPESPEVPSDTELLLEASLKRQNARNQQKAATVQPIRKTEPPVQPRLFDRRGTGTDGPAPAPAAPPPIPAVYPKRYRTDQVPCNVALREILAFVAIDPGTAGWSDQARQDIASTILIAEYKAGRISRWERNQEPAE